MFVCVYLCVFAYMCSIAKCICVVQRAFKGLCVDNWECAGVQRPVSLCLFIYISVLFAMNYGPLPACCSNLRSQNVLSGLAPCPGLGGAPLRSWHPTGSNPMQARQGFIKQRWTCVPPVPLPALSISLAFLPLCCFPYIHIQQRGLIFF